jgi:aryl-alcohol dehydrogenase-like predicted oxidoreductase
MALPFIVQVSYRRESGVKDVWVILVLSRIQMLPALVYVKREYTWWIRRFPHRKFARCLKSKIELVTFSVFKPRFLAAWVVL